MPVVCFYKDDQLLLSHDYVVIKSSNQQSTTAFLQQIQTEYQKQMKIVQINFDYNSTATVYVLNTYELKNKNVFTSSITDPEILFKSSLSKNSFTAIVNKIKRDIAQGRYYQVNFTSSFTSVQKHSFDAYELFKYYFLQFQSEFSAFLPAQDDQSEILCYSPELFLEKTNSKIKTQPIKGTTQDLETFDHLLNNQKENAELSMIVDLLRNDLQSVCNDKVTVPHHRARLHLNYVTHTFSEVTGHTNKQLPEILEHMLPAGSISGCPKIESIKAIHDYEINSRGFYTGCIGWWIEDDFKLNLAIRSFENKKNTLTYYSGCGIVYDSIAENEWQEFHNKAKHLKMIKIVDTLQISKNENARWPIHIQRSFEALHLMNSNITLTNVENIYARIPKSLEIEKCRLEINPFDLDSTQIQISSLDDIDSDLRLQIAKNKTQTAGVGLQNYKTNQRQYWNSSQSAYEILGVNTEGYITETARFNIFLKKDNVVYTPSLNSGCINGVFRRQALKDTFIEIKGQKLPLKEKDFKPNDIQNIEIYLGNSLRGLHKARLITEDHV